MPAEQRVQPRAEAGVAERMRGDRDSALGVDNLEETLRELEAIFPR